MIPHPPECDKGIVGDVLNPVVGQVQAGEDPQGPQGLHWNLSQRIVCQVETLQIVVLQMLSKIYIFISMLPFLNHRHLWCESESAINKDSNHRPDH